MKSVARGIALGLTCLFWAHTAASADRGWASVSGGTVVLFRHALAPGGGDPSGYTLNDCSTQRNLSSEGRDQARRIGAEFRQRRIAVGAVWSSQWCRTRDTADLAFPGLRTDQPIFNSFFNESEAAADRTRAAQQLLSSWRGPGVLVVVTHQVNITALTGVMPSSGEGVVVRPSANGVQVVGSIPP
ncbi:MAG: histidine phosphatase family protein [Rhodoferax sp.]|nr:histidine phosphatase family protein [Rhodoferax sp.]